MSIELDPRFWGHGVRHAVIIGINSDIAQELKSRLEPDGWTVSGTKRRGNEYRCHDQQWDLLIVCQGTMEPIGRFFECDSAEWEDCVSVNAFYPLGWLRDFWPTRKDGAKICFLGGPNLTKPSPSYTAYRAGKAMLDSLVTTLNVEYPQNSFFVLNPGVVRTKIHHQTLAAGPDRAANYHRVKDIVDGVEQTNSHDEVYRRLMIEMARGD